MPDLGGDGAKRKDGEYDHAGYTAALDERRREALHEIVQSEGWNGILELVRRAQVPGAAGDALAQLDRAAYQDDCLTLLDSDNGNDELFAASYSRVDSGPKGGTG